MRALIRPLRSDFVGLVIAVPVVALSLPASHLADRFSRKTTLGVLSANNFGSAGPRFMETPCHSSTAETAPREQTIGVYRVDFRTSRGVSSARSKNQRSPRISAADLAKHFADRGDKVTHVCLVDAADSSDPKAVGLARL